MSNKIFPIFIIGLFLIFTCRDLEEIDFLEITTLEVETKTKTSALLVGAISGLNVRFVERYGFIWSASSPMPTEIDNDGLLQVEERKQSDKFSLELANILPNKTYYYRAFAQLEGTDKKVLGMPQTFMTNTIEFNTDTVLYTGGTTASIVGNITGLADDNPIIQYGHVWSYNHEEPTLENGQFSNLGKIEKDGTFTSLFPNLEDTKTYYIRAYLMINDGRDIIYENKSKEYSSKLFDIWTAKQNLPSGNIGAGVAFVISDTAYVGFNDNRKLWQFIPDSPTEWIPVDDEFPGNHVSYATAFVIGRKGYVGLNQNNPNEFYEFNADTQKWSKMPPLPFNNVIDRPPSFVLHGKAYVITDTSKDDFDYNFHQYDPNTGIWTPLNIIAEKNLHSRSYFTLNNKGYIVGVGKDNNKVIEYDPITNEWNDKATLPGGGTWFGTGFSIESKGKGYFSTGISFGLQQSRQLWEYNPSTDKWARKRNLPETADPRQLAVGFSIKDKGYVGFGILNFSANGRDVWEYTAE